MKELKRFARSAGEQIMIVGGEIGHANTDAVATLHICPCPSRIRNMSPGT